MANSVTTSTKQVTNAELLKDSQMRTPITNDFKLGQDNAITEVTTQYNSPARVVTNQMDLNPSNNTITSVGPVSRTSKHFGKNSKSMAPR